MRLRTRSDALDRRAQDAWRRPEVAPVHLGLALALVLTGLLVPASRAFAWTSGAVWAVLGVVSLLARRRDRR